VHARVLSCTLTREIAGRSNDIKCRFGQQAVAATVVSIESCVCVSPPFQRNGSVSVEVSFDGGQVRDYEKFVAQCARTFSALVLFVLYLGEEEEEEKLCHSYSMIL
jgi:hypothetical protein